jgi:hypothetical protein
VARAERIFQPKWSCRNTPTGHCKQIRDCELG